MFEVTGCQAVSDIAYVSGPAGFSCRPLRSVFARPQLVSNVANPEKRTKRRSIQLGPSKLGRRQFRDNIKILGGRIDFRILEFGRYPECAATADAASSRAPPRHLPQELSARLFRAVSRPSGERICGTGACGRGGVLTFASTAIGRRDKGDPF